MPSSSYTRVIFITAGVLCHDTLEFATKMADRLFEKPVVLPALRETIRRLMG